MISEFFTQKSVTDRALVALVKDLKLFGPFNAWTNGNIFKGIGSFNAQDETTSLPLCFVLPNEEDEKTTPGQNSKIGLSFVIAIAFEIHEPIMAEDETTILTVADAVKGHLFRKEGQSLRDENGQVLTQAISGFRVLAYDSIEFEDGGVMGLCPLIVDYVLSVKTAARIPSVATS